MEYLNKLGVNVDPATGIHYGTCYASDEGISPDAIDDFVADGEPQRYLEAESEVEGELSSSFFDIIKEVVDKYGYMNAHVKDRIKMHATSFAEDVFSDLIAETMETSEEIYRWERNGYIITYHSADNGIWVEKSPYFAMCNKCSPCAPNAGYIGQEGSIKTYVLGHDFYEDGKAPFPIFDVVTEKEVAP